MRRVGSVALLGFLICLVSPSYALQVILQSETTLYVAPPAIEVSLCDFCSIDVVVGDVVDLIGFEFYLSYNTTILDVVAASIHPPFWEWGGIDVNDTGGYLHAYATLLGSPSLSGSLVLISVTFNTTSLGESGLHLYDSILADSSPSPIPHTTIDGWVIVPWNIADINDDLVVDIYDVVLGVNAYGSIPGDPHWNPDCDIAEPFGKVDLMDIVMIAMNYGDEYTP